MKLSEIKPNPNNPRVLRDERFEKLKQSIQEFPKMMSLRPMVIDSDGIILGGNMRYRALQDLGYKEVPDEWVKRAEELTWESNRIPTGMGRSMRPCRSNNSVKFP